MIDFEEPAEPAVEFAAALISIKQSGIRDELVITQLAAPQDIATHAIAFSAELKSATSEVSGKLGTGRFVLFWSPKPQENWTSNFRVVCFARSPLESDIGRESDGVDVTWDWLTSALNNSGAEHSALAGTTTRIISTGHGLMDTQSDHAEIEIRASWSPTGTDIGKHLEAWQNLVCVMSGYQIAPGVQNINFG
ncbi:MAG: DUF3000 family protein [Micrococcales bacterium]